MEKARSEVVILNAFAKHVSLSRHGEFGRIEIV